MSIEELNEVARRQDRQTPGMIVKNLADVRDISAFGVLVIQRMMMVRI
jgi:hypothetical protein